MRSSNFQSRPVSPRFFCSIRRRRLVAGLIATALAVAIPAVSGGPAAAAVPNFPGAAWSKALGPTHLSSPTIADVNGDHHLDIVTADLSGMLHVVDGRNGHELPGWPQRVQPRAGSTAAVESSPTVADLDRNGRKQIIVGAGSVDVPYQQGGVVAFNANGSVRFRVQTMTIAGQNAVQGTPAVGDVTGDGFADIVFGSFDHRIYALNRFGGALPGFPMDSLDTIWSSPALYDAGGIGRMDIFLGGDASPGGPCGSQTWSGIMRAIRVTSGGPQILWSRCRHQIYQSSPAIGRLGSNGRMALVVGTGNGPSGDAFATNSLSAFYLDNGSTVPGWPVLLNGSIFGSPVIGDVNGDHRNDVVVTACAICNDGRVWAFNGNGGALWNRRPNTQQTEILSTPILVDLDGNGVNDVAVGQAGSFNFLRGRDGATLYQPIEINRVVQNSAAVANFGPGYGWRIVIQSWRPQGDGQPKHGSGRVDAFPLPKAPKVAPAWPQWRLTPNHVGAPKAPPPVPARAGYWLVAGDGGIFSYGNARYYGSTGGMHLNQPINGMARTALGRGYWLVASDGGMFTFGDAHFYGSTGGQPLAAPIITLTRTTSGNGYWLVGQNGDVYPFGDAKFYGSAGGIALNRPIVTAAASRAT